MAKQGARKAIVIGAGIGGLCTAIALVKKGWDVSIFEKATALREAGAGIALAANAMRVLEMLGVAEQVRSEGSKVGSAEIRNWSGKLLVKLPAEEQARLYGTYSYVIHRAQLQSVLLNALKDVVPIHLNQSFVNFVQNGERATAIFADGTEVEADVLIGADGFHSAVRERMIGPSPIRYSGYYALRGVCDFEDKLSGADGGGFEALGPGKRFGLSSLGNGRSFWYAAINSPQGRLPAVHERKSAALEFFREWYPPVVSAIRATDEHAILAHDIVDRKPLHRWSSGSVTLVGDAAHPMLPNLGQGGAQAMEDAVVLARCLERSNVREALAEYERERKGRTAKIVRLSRSMGRMVQLENPLMIKARDLILSSMPSRIFIKRFDPIAGYRVNGASAFRMR